MSKPQAGALEGLERRALDNLNIGVQIIDADYRYLYVNEAAAKQGRTTRERLVGRTMMDVYPGINDTLLAAAIRECMAQRTSQQLQNDFVFPDGLRGWFEISLAPMPEGLLILSSDVAERKRHSETTKRTTRARVILARCNQSLLRATDEQDFVQQLCDIVVQAGFRMAWVGLAEHDEAKTVRPIASAGMDEGYVEQLHITWDANSRGRGPTGRAIRISEPYVSRFIATDLDFAPWRNQAMAHGFASCIALPIRINGETAGAITIYAAEKDAFDDDEQQLLSQLSHNVGFGLTALRAHAASTRATEELADIKEHYRLLVELCPSRYRSSFGRQTRFFQFGRCQTAGCQFA